MSNQRVDAKNSEHHKSPPGIERLESFFNSFDGTKLYFQRWKPKNPKGILVITHGQGEHSECYHRVVTALASLQLDIWAWDLRGHGRSEGKRGFANSGEEYYKDYSLFMEKIIGPQVGDKKLFLLAHSMGGLIQLVYLSRQAMMPKSSKLPVAAQICSAPLLGVAVPVPKIKEGAAHLLNRLMPKMTLGNEITNDMVTRDIDIIKEFESDIYRHGRISSGVYLSFGPLAEEVSMKASLIHVPTLFQLPEDDPVVSTPVAREVFKKIGTKEKTLLIYGEGARHEMYNDLNRETVFADLRRYIETQLGNSSAKSTKGDAL